MAFLECMTRLVVAFRSFAWPRVLIREQMYYICVQSRATSSSVEVMRKGELRGRMAATNVFERQGGEWKIIHHQAGQISWS